MGVSRWTDYYCDVTLAFIWYSLQANINLKLLKSSLTRLIATFLSVSLSLSFTLRTFLYGQVSAMTRRRNVRRELHDAEGFIAVDALDLLLMR